MSPVVRYSSPRAISAVISFAASLDGVVVGTGALAGAGLVLGCGVRVATAGGGLVAAG